MAARDAAPQGKRITEKSPVMAYVSSRLSRKCGPLSRQARGGSHPFTESLRRIVGAFGPIGAEFETLKRSEP